MDVYRTEEEQVEAIKKWFRRYGLSAALAIIAAVALSFAYRTWQENNVQRAENASAIYEQMILSAYENQAEQFQSLSQRLVEDYASTPYASLAAMRRASNAVNHGDLDIAESELENALSISKDTALKQVIRIRIARIKLALEKLDEALEILSTIDNENFIAVVEEVKGDIFLSQGDTEKARDAYQIAVASLSAAGVTRNILLMKLQQLNTIG